MNWFWYPVNKKDIFQIQKNKFIWAFRLSQISYLPLRFNNFWYKQLTDIIICMFCKFHLTLGTANATKHFHIIGIFFKLKYDWFTMLY